MITPKVSGSKIVFGPVRLSYVHLFKPWAGQDVSEDQAKYQCCCLIPKNEKETIAAINKCVGEAKKAGVQSKWNGKLPKKLALPVQDGDEREDPAEFEDHLYINAKCKTRPGVIDRFKQPIMDEEEMYSGVWAYVAVRFYPYLASGNAGVAAGLDNVMKFKDDDHLGGRASADVDFDGVGDDMSVDDM